MFVTCPPRSHTFAVAQQQFIRCLDFGRGCIAMCIECDQLYTRQQTGATSASDNEEDELKCRFEAFRK
jgi:hypothetical protein